MKTEETKTKNNTVYQFSRHTHNKDMVLLDDLIFDGKFQSRTRTQADAVLEYSELLKAGIIMPAIRVALISAYQPKYVVLDGHHRVEAAKACGFTDIMAEIYTLTDSQAVMLSATANQTHGIRRSNADKVRSVEMVLGLPESSEMSDREIAAHIGVSHEFVRSRRSELGVSKVPTFDISQSEEQDESDDDESDSDGEVSETKEPKAISDMEAAKNKYMNIVAAIDGVRAQLVCLQSEKIGYSVNWNALDADIKNLKRCLTDSMPYADCCYCNGDGCTVCKGTGWLGKVATEMAPSNLKPKKKAK